MYRSVRLRSLAKVNLDLRVLHRRADRFHELRTIFQTISLADTIEIDYAPAERTRLSLSPNVEIPGENLIVRAAEAVLDHMGLAASIEFRLDKRIPMGGGLGGGSSNAASTLLALPVLAGRRVELEELMPLAAALGSDVPFFLLGGTAAGLGRGTELYPLPDAGPARILVVAPGLHVSTPDAYRALARPRAELTSAGSSRIINSFQSSVWRLAQERLAGDGGALCANDFESVVFGQFPQLQAIKGKLLKMGASPVMMTGSGSALFGVVRSPETVERARRSFPKEWLYSVSLVSRRRYRQLWRRQLREHLDAEDLNRDVWPPQSRYAQ